MIVAGKNPVRELISSGATINKLWVQNNLNDNVSNNIIKLAKNNNIHIDFVSKQVLDKKCGNHQGFVCDTVDFKYCQISDILDYATKCNQPPFIVILDGIEDPHNLGAIIRTCECAGVHGIIIPQHRSCLVNDTVIKTSAGATANMRICMVNNINNAINQLKTNGIWIYGLELGGQDIYSQNMTGPIALVVGSEGFGIKNVTKQNCDCIVTLAQYGKINSLNASVSCGIAIYEILRQRQWKV